MNLRQLAQQRNFIRDIFMAIDEDGSGTMEMDELIKALLSLCLSQDIQFAKEIISLFEENMIVKQQTKLTEYRLMGVTQAKSKYQQDQIQYSFKDFVKIFKTDPIGHNIVSTLNSEIMARHRLKLKSEAATTAVVPEEIDGESDSGQEEESGRRNEKLLHVNIRENPTENRQQESGQFLGCHDESAYKRNSLKMTLSPIQLRKEADTHTEHSFSSINAPGSPSAASSFHMLASKLPNHAHFFKLIEKLREIEHSPSMKIEEQPSASEHDHDSEHLGSKHRFLDIDKLQHECNTQYKKRINIVKKQIGPLIGQQNELINEWWQQLTREHAAGAPQSSSTGIPEQVVTKFLVKKGIVMDRNQALRLYKVTYVCHRVGSSLRAVSKADFTKMFYRYIFVDALIKVTQEID